MRLTLPNKLAILLVASLITGCDEYTFDNETKTIVKKTNKEQLEDTPAEIVNINADEEDNVAENTQTDKTNQTGAQTTLPASTETNNKGTNDKGTNNTDSKTAAIADTAKTKQAKNDSKQSHKAIETSPIKIFFYNKKLQAKAETPYSLRLVNKENQLIETIKTYLKGVNKEEVALGFTSNSLGINSFKIKLKDKTVYIDFMAKDLQVSSPQQVIDFTASIYSTTQQFEQIDKTEICINGIYNYQMALFSNVSAVACPFTFTKKPAATSTKTTGTDSTETKKAMPLNTSWYGDYIYFSGSDTISADSNINNQQKIEKIGSMHKLTLTKAECEITTHSAKVNKNTKCQIKATADPNVIEIMSLNGNSKLYEIHKNEKNELGLKTVNNFAVTFHPLQKLVDNHSTQANGKISNKTRKDSNKSLNNHAAQNSFIESYYLLESLNDWLKMQTSEKTVIAKLGQPTSKGDEIAGEQIGSFIQKWTYKDKGIILDMQSLKKDGEKKVLTMLVTSGSKYQTTQGIKIGSSKQEVLNAYAGLIVKKDFYQYDVVIGTVDGGVIFYFQDDKVVEIFVGAFLAE